EMYTDPKVDTPLRWKPRIALQHAVLHFHGATHSVDHAAKLDKGSVAGTLNHAPVMHRDGRVDEITSERPKPRQRAILVGSREPTVADYIGGENCRDFPCLGHADRSPGKNWEQWKFMGLTGRVSIAVPGLQSVIRVGFDRTETSAIPCRI